jgi:3-dehydroquinate synthase
MPTTIRIKFKKIVANSYDIVIGTSLRQVATDITRLQVGSRQFIITDSNVAKYYANDFVRMLRKSGGIPQLLIVPAGEKSKSRRTKELLEDKLISLNAGRDCLIIALGGGMIGDLAGFVAATLHRGVPYVQIPTTLLAQVDSSIGGKVAVNHPKGKNLIGAFYQPRKVYIDVSTLSTLSNKEFRNGIAEVIKYAAILDNKLFSYLERNNTMILSRNMRSLNRVIQRCCELKKIVVEKDEKETGYRRILNFGHTIGHSLEQLSNYALSHGESVSIGMAAEARISVLMNLSSDRVLERLTSLIKLYGIPTQIPSRYEIKQIVLTTLRDKKMQHDKVHYTLLKRISKARIGIPISDKAVLKFLSA